MREPMRESVRDHKGRWAVGAALVLVVGWGCFDFDAAYKECQLQGNCPLPAGTCDPQVKDAPDDAFQDSNCDGIDGTASDALFVDPVAGQDQGLSAGTRSTPFRTIKAALEQARQTGKALYLAQGQYNEPGLRLDRPISLYGGYSGKAGDWARGEQYATIINGVGIGLTVAGLGEDAGVVLDRFTLNAASLPDAGGAPCIGVRILNSAGIQMKHVEVRPGAGNDGSPPAPAISGADGGMGGGGGVYDYRQDDRTKPPGGTPGVGGCDPDSAPAGMGGTGGTFYDRPSRGQDGAPGVAGGTEGGAGAGCNQTCATAVGGDAGSPGLSGDVGGPGGEGDGIGGVNQDTWLANFGETGTAGKPGSGGGGGGGGGQATNNATYSNGGGGGGGGGGGCGGGGGKGGQGGGASIGVLLVNGQVSLESCPVRLSNGGGGAPGAEGGAGGTGGPGGPGGVALSAGATGSTFHGGNGGSGGAGGRGGAGGAGGGGGGGPSVGVWCQGSSSVSTRGTTISLGLAGKPGARSTATAQPVLRMEYYQCPGSQ